jgi:hypothetical protein
MAEKLLDRVDICPSIRPARRGYVPQVMEGEIINRGFLTC